MEYSHSRKTLADALVVFGVTDDPAHKMIFPALSSMVKRGDLNVPVAGVAASKWSVAQLCKLAEDSIKQALVIRSARHIISLSHVHCSPL